MRPLTTLLLIPLLLALAACGTCEGRVTNAGASHGQCTVLSIGL